MNKKVEIILKKKNLNDVKIEIRELKVRAKNNFNMDSFNVPATENCVRTLNKLIELHTAASIMLTTTYKAYEESGKKMLYSEFLGTI